MLVVLNIIHSSYEEGSNVPSLCDDICDYLCPYLPHSNLFLLFSYISQDLTYNTKERDHCFEHHNLNMYFHIDNIRLVYYFIFILD